VDASYWLGVARENGAVTRQQNLSKRCVFPARGSEKPLEKQ